MGRGAELLWSQSVQQGEESPWSEDSPGPFFDRLFFFCIGFTNSCSFLHLFYFLLAPHHTFSTAFLFSGLGRSCLSCNSRCVRCLSVSLSSQRAFLRNSLLHKCLQLRPVNMLLIPLESDYVNVWHWKADSKSSSDLTISKTWRTEFRAGTEITMSSVCAFAGSQSLPSDSVLSRILQTQMLDTQDIEGLYPLYRRVEQHLQDFPKER